MKINEIYSALGFDNFKDYKNFADDKKAIIRDALKKNPRILLHCKVPQDKMASVVDDLGFSAAEKFDFACNLVKFKVLKKTSAGFASMAKLQESFNDRQKEESFKNLINETAQQSDKQIADEEYISDITFDLRKNYDDGGLQQAANWRGAFGKLNERQNLAYLANLLKRFFFLIAI